MISQAKPRTLDVIDAKKVLNPENSNNRTLQLPLVRFHEFMGNSLQQLNVGIITARFNPTITEPLRLGAMQVFQQCGFSQSQVRLGFVPGAVELPLAARWMIESQGVDAVVCLGCVIRGDTNHFDYVCSMAANGIQQVSLDTGKPVVFGVLTCDTQAQALARTLEANAQLDATTTEALDGLSPMGNKGMDAAHAALEMLALHAGLTAQATPVFA